VFRLQQGTFDMSPPIFLMQAGFISHPVSLPETINRCSIKQGGILSVPTISKR
jgi:hypothetical protein